MTTFMSIRLLASILLVNTGFYLVSGNQDNCVCEQGNGVNNCTEFRCPINKCGNFHSSYNVSCLCGEDLERKIGCVVLNTSEKNQTNETRSCNEYHSFICSDDNNNFQIYDEENKTWSGAVEACEQRNLHIAQGNLSFINYPSQILFWIGSFYGSVPTGNPDGLQYQMTRNNSGINSSSVTNVRCDILPVVLQLTTSSVSPTSATVNITTEPGQVNTTDNGTSEGSSTTENETLSLVTSNISTTPKMTTTTSDASQSSSVTTLRTTDTSHAVTTTYGSTDVSSSNKTETSSLESTTPEVTTTSDVSVMSSKMDHTNTLTTSEHTEKTFSTTQTPTPPSTQETTASPTEATTTADATTSSITSTEPSTSTKPTVNGTTSTTVNNMDVNNGSTEINNSTTPRVVNNNPINGVSKPTPSSSKQNDQDNTPILAGALSGGAVLLIIGATVLYIKYRRNQNQTKKLRNVSGIAAYTDKSLKGKPRDYTHTQNPIYLPRDDNVSNGVGDHDDGNDTAAQSENESNYDHFETKKVESENDTYDRTPFNIQVDPNNEYGVLHQKNADIVDDTYDHTGALMEGVYGQLHKQDETSRPDSDIYGTSQM